MISKVIVFLKRFLGIGFKHQMPIIGDDFIQIGDEIIHYHMMVDDRDRTFEQTPEWDEWERKWREWYAKEYKNTRD